MPQMDDAQVDMRFTSKIQQDAGPIEAKTRDLRMNVDDTHQLLNELEMRIGGVLAREGDDTTPAANPTDSVRASSSVYHYLHDVDVSVLSLQERIRDLIRRVEL